LLEREQQEITFEQPTPAKRFCVGCTQPMGEQCPSYQFIRLFVACLVELNRSDAVAEVFHHTASFR